MPQDSRRWRDDVRLEELSTGSTLPGQAKVTRRQAVVGLGTAAALVGASWLIGGRISLSEIGSGGVARRYLPRVGERAPALGMFGRDGRVVFLSSFLGTPVWINFWGSWCPPCQAELPEIETAYLALAPQGVALLAISVKESFATAETFARVNGGTFPVYNIPDPTVTPSSWDVRNFPTHVYIDAAGVIRELVLGPGSGAQLIRQGERLLASGVGD